MLLPSVTTKQEGVICLTFRFRVISNVVMNCPVELYIEGHSLTVISSDGADFHPVETDVIVISGGERSRKFYLLNQSGV